VITLFHKPSTAASTRVLTFLKQANANAASTATEDQASDHPVSGKDAHPDFTLDVQEGPPTSDQLNSILEYVGAHNAGQIISGARDRADAMAKLKEDAELFKRPLVSYVNRAN
jgi:arsenate reductase-like glutaredoxin family protein